jgi:hypothetical protein
MKAFWLYEMSLFISGDNLLARSLEISFAKRMD